MIMSSRITYLFLVVAYWSSLFLYPDGDIRISNQLLITRALYFAQPQAYYQASVTITLGRRA